MAKKRVHEIAKAQGVSSKELLAALKAAGIEAKAAASSVEENDALQALSGPKGNGGAAATATATKPKPAQGAEAAQPKAKPVKAPAKPAEKKAGGGASGKKRRVVIDSQAARRDQMGGPPPQRPPRRRGGRRRRPLLEEPPLKTEEPAEPEATKVPSGATVREVAELLGLGSAEVIKKLMTMGEMATLTQTLTDESIKAIADEYDRKLEIVTAADEEPEAPEYEDSDESLATAAAGGHDHGPRRPRQDLAARRDPRDRGRRRRGRGDHPAHRRLPGPPRQDGRSPSSTRPATPPSRRCAPAGPRSPTSR